MAPLDVHELEQLKRITNKCSNSFFVIYLGKVAARYYSFFILFRGISTLFFFISLPAVGVWLAHNLAATPRWTGSCPNDHHDADSCRPASTEHLILLKDVCAKRNTNWSRGAGNHRIGRFRHLSRDKRSTRTHFILFRLQLSLAASSVTQKRSNQAWSWLRRYNR